jgi:WD40 repeat protein
VKGTEKVIKLWNVATGKELLSWQGHSESVMQIAFAPDGKMLASASSSRKDATIKVWDAATRKEVLSLAGHKGFIFQIAFSPDGKLLGSVSPDRTVKLWEVATGKERASFALGVLPFCLAFSSDGKTLAVGTDIAGLEDLGSGQVHLWDLAAGTKRSVFAAHFNEPVAALAFSPDGKTLATGGAHKTVCLWDVTKQQRRATLSGHEKRIGSLAFSPDGKTLATGSFDKTVRLWDLTRQPDRNPNR